MQADRTPVGLHRRALDVAARAQILIEQVVILVNVVPLCGTQLAAVARALDLCRDTDRVQPVEFVTDRSARLAGRKWLGAMAKFSAKGSCGMVPASATMSEPA
jgi:hypothetical protein